jgi:hypothetical protein
MPFDGSVASALEQSMAHEIGREVIGTEVLDGHPTTVFQITTREEQRDVIYYQWWAEDLHLPLRIARKDGPGSLSIRISNCARYLHVSSKSRSIIDPWNPL